MSFKENHQEVLAEAYTVRVARSLLQSGVVRFDFKDGFHFTNGLHSPVYCDGTMLASHPKAWLSTLKAAAAYARNADVVVGVAVGALVHSAALARMLQKPHAFVRKERKEHGAHGLLAGAPVAGKNILLIEDTVTTGRSLLNAVHALMESGAASVQCVALVTYGFPFSARKFQGAGFSFSALTNVRTIIEEAEKCGRITGGECRKVEKWFDSVSAAPQN